MLNDPTTSYFGPFPLPFEHKINYRVQALLAIDNWHKVPFLKNAGKETLG